MVIEKIRNLSLKKKILWGLGILIVVILISSMANTIIYESERKAGFKVYTEKNSRLVYDDNASLFL